MRRLTDTQVTYYRAAHRLVDIDEQLTHELAGPGRPEADLPTIGTALGEITQWLHDHDEQWQCGDTWRLQDVLRSLKQKAEQLGRYRQDGWPDSGGVAHLKPRR